jgi:hypothetical protein
MVDGIKLVRTDLHGRLDALEMCLTMRGPLGTAEQAAAIVAIATEYGLTSVQRLAEGLTVALSAGGRGAAVGPWMERLREAIDSPAAHDGQETTWLASVFSRLAG